MLKILHLFFPWPTVHKNYRHTADHGKPLFISSKVQNNEWKFNKCDFIFPKSEVKKIVGSFFISSVTKLDGSNRSFIRFPWQPENYQD